MNFNLRSHYYPTTVQCATLVELVDYVNLPAGQKIFTEGVMEDVVAMVATNIFRWVRVIAFSCSLDIYLSAAVTFYFVCSSTALLLSIAQVVFYPTSSSSSLFAGRCHRHS